MHYFFLNIFLLFAVISAVIWNSMIIILMDDFRKPNLTIHEMLMLLLFSGACLAAVLTMIIFTRCNSVFIDGLEHLNNADLLMKQLRINVPYILPRFMTIGQIVFSIASIGSMTVYELIVIEKTLPRIFHEKLSFHISLLILTTANYHYIGTVCLLYLRFKRVNNFLEKIEENCETSKKLEENNIENQYLYNKRTIIFTLRTITEIQDQLISCGTKINNVFSFSLFSFIQLMTCGFLGQMFSFLSSSHVFSTQTNVAGFIIYALFLLPILIPSEFTMIEVK